jgi:2-amino-4-hydroxy-6-hydroxymethyldihydropteridine diphosphokinase
MTSAPILNRAAIALGANLGDTVATLNSAIAVLAQHPNITLISRSSWYQTAAVGPPQPDYINGCIVIETELEPQELLTLLLTIEDQFGRVRQERWGARTLDLDLLLYSDRTLSTPHLELPHPRMAIRAFVLVPLAEIAPTWIDPISSRSIEQLVLMVNCTEVQRFPQVTDAC